MRRYSPLYFLSQSFHGLWRNGFMTIASITVLMSCLVLIGSFASLAYNVNMNLESVTNANEIVVFAEYDADAAAVETMKNDIGALDNVAEVIYVSKEEALQMERERNPEHANLYDYVSDDNPLSDSFRVRYADNAGVESLLYQLKQVPGARKVSSSVEIAKDIDNVKNGVSFIFIWFLAILFIVSIFIIINTIKITVETRSHEISAMRYVGATNYFMSVPFVLEGAFIGAIAAALACVVQWYLYRYTYNAIGTNYSMLLTVVPYDNIRQYLILGFFVVGILTGVVGSSISLRRYMKV